MSRIRNLIGEIHRRSVWQVLGIYLVGSWGALQVVEGVANSAGLPDWVPAMALVLLVIGLPICVATAFVQEGLPGVEESRKPAQGHETPVEAAAVVPNLAAGTGSLDRPTTRPTARARLFTWRHAILGGLGAFTLLGISIFGYFVMWSSGFGPVGSLAAQGVFAEREPLVLVEFTTTAADPGIGRLVTEALRVDLVESSALSVVPDSYLAEAKQRMGLAPDATVTAEIAREIAQRDGIKAIIVGEVGALGGGYVLTASLVEASSGRPLAAFRETIPGDNALLAAIDKLSERIRSKAGESLREIRQGESLAEVTTASLEALRAYTEAIERNSRGEDAEALALLEAALELDPDFGMAWRKLSVLIRNGGGDPAEGDAALQRAYDLREGTGETERWLTEAYYFTNLDVQPQRAIQAYERVLAINPDEQTALNNLALRLSRDDKARAVQLLERAVSSPGGGVFVANTNLLNGYWDTRRDAEALALSERILERYPTSGAAHNAAITLLTVQGRLAEAHDQGMEGLRTASIPEGRRVNLQYQLAAEDVGMGRFAEALEHFAVAIRLATIEERPTWAVDAHAAWAYSAAILGLDERMVLEAVRAALALTPVDRMSADGRVAANVIAALGFVGRSDQAQALLSEYEAATPIRSMSQQEREAHHYMQWAVAMGQRDLEVALDRITTLQFEHLRCGDYRCWGWWERARVLEEMGRLDEAQELFARAIEGTSISEVRWFPTLLADALERHARLADAAGDVEDARASYSRLISLWADADAVLQPRVTHARNRLAALGSG
ncbi:MAG: tetratricopeptide repeat protein [Gemmatimonadetes bacterium]|nr:tetratricopeptide repeat protein [Gemmatimonadota bacterium]